MPLIVEITKTFKFEASHVLPRHSGKCSQLHGHSWELTIGVSGEIDSYTHFVMDYAELKKLVNENLINHIDHSHLGCGLAVHGFTNKTQLLENLVTDHNVAGGFFGPDFYPSSENLVVAIAQLLQPLIANSVAVDKDGKTPKRWLSLVSLKETCTSEATWRPVTFHPDSTLFIEDNVK